MRLSMGSQTTRGVDLITSVAMRARRTTERTPQIIIGDIRTTTGGANQLIIRAKLQRRGSYILFNPHNVIIIRGHWRVGLWEKIWEKTLRWAGFWERVWERTLRWTGLWERALKWAGELQRRGSNTLLNAHKASNNIRGHRREGLWERTWERRLRGAELWERIRKGAFNWTGLWERIRNSRTPRLKLCRLTSGAQTPAWSCIRNRLGLQTHRHIHR